MQFLTGITRNAQSKSYMPSLTECVWDFQNNALWDAHCHAQSDIYFLYTDVRVDDEEAITRRHVVTPHVAVVCAR